MVKRSLNALRQLSVAMYIPAIRQKVEPIVRGIIDSFRKGDRDNVAVWLEKQGRPFYVNYMAVRDQNNNYIGTLELVQDMQFCKKTFR